MDRLVLGCGRLHAGADRAQSIELVRTALACGVRNFDVAPSYALGAAHKVLSEALGTSRETVSIATKVGIANRVSPGLLQSLRRVAKPMMTYIPGLREMAYRAIGSAGAQGKLDFSDLEPLKTSFASSLQALGVGRVDTLFLHDPPPGTAVEQVEDWMSELRARGLITHFGCGTQGPLEDVVPLGDTTQFLCGPLGALKAAPTAHQRVHGVVRGVGGDIAAMLATRPELAESLHDEWHLDTGNREHMAALAIAYVLARSDARVVIAPKNAQRLVAIVDALHGLIHHARLPELLTALESHDAPKVATP